MKFLIFNLLFVFSSTQTLAALTCQQLLQINTVSKVSEEIESRNLYQHRIKNNLKIALFNFFKNQSMDLDVVDQKVESVTTGIFSNSSNANYYMEVLLKGIKVEEIDLKYFEANVGRNFFSDFDPQQLGAIFLVGKSMKSKRKAILGEVKKLEKLLPPDLATNEVLSNFSVPALIYTLLHEPESKLLNSLIVDSKISVEQVSALTSHLEKFRKEILEDESSENLFYPEHFKTPQEFTPFHNSPSLHKSLADKVLTRIAFNSIRPSEGITLISLGVSDLFVTMSHNLRYLNNKIEAEKEVDPQSTLTANDANGNLVKVELETVKEMKISDNAEMDIALIKIKGLSKSLEKTEFANPDLGSDVHVFGFPAKRRMVKSASNDGYSRPDYSSGKVVSLDGYNFTTTALGAMGSSGSVAFNDKGQAVGILWDISDSFRAVKKDSENIKAAYDFGTLRAAPDHTMFISLSDLIGSEKPTQ